MSAFTHSVIFHTRKTYMVRITAGNFYIQPRHVSHCRKREKLVPNRRVANRYIRYIRAACAMQRRHAKSQRALLTSGVEGEYTVFRE